jgi:hypothetical protein
MKGATHATQANLRTFVGIDKKFGMMAEMQKFNHR